MTSTLRSACIPPNFPRGGRCGTVSGAHPKTLVRKVDGRLLTGLTEEEIRARYDLCADLLMQLEAYCERSQRERPDLDRSALLRRVRVEVGQRGWDVSEAELDWIMGELGLPIELVNRTLVPWQVAPSWLEEFLAKANDIPPRQGQLRAMLKESVSRQPKNSIR